MSIERRDRNDARVALLERAAAADLRADARLRGAIDDVFRSHDARLDDRTRSAIATLLGDVVLGVDRALRRDAARSLASQGAGALADAVSAASAATLDRLVEAGLIRDEDLMREVLGRVRENLLADALPPGALDEPARASLLARLGGCGDVVLAPAAIALLAAERHARTRADVATGLPAELHRRLVWWVTAALRERLANAAGDALPLLDRALAEAAQRSIGAHDDSERLEVAAASLADVLDAQAGELPDLLTEALADRQLALFIALLSQALRVAYADVRDIVLDPEGERLWLMLRALDLDRPHIARIALTLSDADPRRDIDAFADHLDDIVSVGPDTARDALAPLLLHREYRAALVALGRHR